MKPLTHCPKCLKPLLSEYREIATTGKHFWSKSCSSYNHKFFSSTKTNLDDELYDIGFTILMQPNYTVIRWRFDLNNLVIENYNSTINLPFFEPDFSDFNKLFHKLKTYMVFS